MRNFDELDEIVAEYRSSKMDRRTFISRAIAMGLTLSSINAFLSSSGKFVKDASAQTPPPGKPAHIVVAYAAYWLGNWPSIVARELELWKKYLPAGSKIDWDNVAYGAVIVNNMLANKATLGILGDMPAYIATTKRDIADLRIITCDLYSPNGQICSNLLIRSDAPKFKNIDEAVSWLNDKKIGVAGKGSCSDRFYLEFAKKTHLKGEVSYLDPTIIKTSLQARKVDAIFIWEPHGAQMENLGFGRLLFTGAKLGLSDGGFTVMRKDFIDGYPEAAKGWVKAEIEGYQFVLKNPYETSKLVVPDLPGFTTKDLWMALYGQNTVETGTSNPKVVAQIGFTKEIMDFIDGGFKFLRERGAINIDKPLPGAIYTQLVDEAVKEMKVKIPLGTIKVFPPSEFKM